MIRWLRVLGAVIMSLCVIAALVGIILLLIVTDMSKEGALDFLVMSIGGLIGGALAGAALGSLLMGISQILVHLERLEKAIELRSRTEP